MATTNICLIIRDTKQNTVWKDYFCWYPIEYSDDRYVYIVWLEAVRRRWNGEHWELGVWVRNGRNQTYAG